MNFIDFINNLPTLTPPSRTQFSAIFILSFTPIFIFRSNCEPNINFKFKNTHLIDKLLILFKRYLHLILFSSF